jgi:hypothetical protein
MQINVGEDEEKWLKYDHVILDQHDIKIPMMMIIKSSLYVDVYK